MRTRSSLLVLATFFLIVFANTSQTFGQASSCFVPGNLVGTDSSEVTLLPYFDIEKVYAAEPIYGDSSQQLAFSMKVRNFDPNLLGLTYPLGTWNVIFSTQGGTTRYVQMSTLLGNPTFTYGTVTYLLNVPIYTPQGAATGAMSNDGLVTISIDKSKIGNPANGSVLNITARTYLNTIGIGLVATDDAPTVSYTLVGNGNCSPYQFAQYGTDTDIPLPADYTRNGAADFGVWRPSTGMWYAIDGINFTQTSMQHGNAELGDIPVAGNFDNDSQADYAVYRPSEGTWYLNTSETRRTRAYRFGVPQDIPLAADYDGDRKDDLIVWRPNEGTWYMLMSNDNSVKAVQFGMAEDRPVTGDFDGDRRADISVFRPSTGVWYTLGSENSAFSAVQWGLGTDVVTPGDFDGDGKTDRAVFRPSQGNWYILKSGNMEMDAVHWGQLDDKPVAADYNGNGRSDVAVWRPSNGVWYVFFR